MAGLVPAIFFGGREEDARDKPGHDGMVGNKVLDSARSMC